METKQKQIQMRHKAYAEHKLKERLAFLAAKGIKSPKAEKDTLARKWKADLKAINNRLRLLAEHDKRSEEMAKIKADRAAGPKTEEAPVKASEGGKSAKPKKAPEEGKEKKAKPEKKAAPSKAAEGGQA